MCFLTGGGCFVEGADWRVQPTAAGVWGATATVPPGAGTTGGVGSGGSRGFVTDFKPPSTPIPPETTIIPSENQISRPNMCYDFRKLPGTSPDNLCLSENESSPVLYPDYQRGCGSLLLLVMEMQYLQTHHLHPNPFLCWVFLLLLRVVHASLAFCCMKRSTVCDGEMMRWVEIYVGGLCLFLFLCWNLEVHSELDEILCVCYFSCMHVKKEKKEGVVACLLSKQLHVTSVWGFELLHLNRLLSLKVILLWASKHTTT